MKLREFRTSKNKHFYGKSSRAASGKALGLVAIGSLLVFTTACGGTSTASSVSTSKASTSSSPSPTPTPSKIAGTACTTEKTTQVGAGGTYVCGVDRAGKLTWLDSATAKKLADERAAEAAAKAAADKAAAEKAAAAKAAADQKAAQAAVPKAAPQAQSGCDPNYSGCVPIASDVDCAGGKGNGPAYVRGPVTVIGTDIYGLDNDGDGIGCEKG